jgi:prophage regulatory protein
MSKKLLSVADLKERGISYCRAQIYRKIKDGSFPRPIHLGENKIAWLESEIDQWIADLAKARSTMEAA